MNHKPLFYNKVLEGRPFVFTSLEDRVRIQIHLLTKFCKGRGQLWVLKDFWSQVGILTVNAASASDFNRSHEHISVSSWSIFYFVACFRHAGFRRHFRMNG